jgi:hypothetical protein
MGFVEPLVSGAWSVLTLDFDAAEVAVRIHKGEWTVKSFLAWLLRACACMVLVCLGLLAILATGFASHEIATAYFNKTSISPVLYVFCLTFSMSGFLFIILSGQELVYVINKALKAWECVSTEVVQQNRMAMLFESTRQLTVAVNELRASRQLDDRRIRNLESRVRELEEENLRLMQGAESPMGYASCSP